MRCTNRVVTRWWSFGAEDLFYVREVALLLPNIAFCVAGLLDQIRPRSAFLLFSTIFVVCQLMTPGVAHLVPLQRLILR